MSSRDSILEAIKRNKPETGSLPEEISFPDTPHDLTERYCQSLQANSGKAFLLNDIQSVNQYIKETFPTEAKICSLIPQVFGNVSVETIIDPHVLENLDVAIIKGEWGASENAAIWFSEKSLHHRVLPFITQHLIVVLHKTSIVKDLHDLYSKIDIHKTGYGVLIAGPSKTADIEQSLVVGAHGPRSMVVFIIE